MSKDIAVITSCYGDHDRLVSPPKQNLDIDWIAVVEPDTVVPAGWMAVREPRPNLHRRTAAKVAKCMPWRYAPHHRITVWLDANVRLKHERSIAQLISWAGANPIAQFTHPDRDCSFAEAEFSAGLAKYAHQPIMAQAQEYRMAGHPMGWGLWATGVIVYQNWVKAYLDAGETGRTLRKFGEAWLLEQVVWTDQDQVSEAPMLRRHSLVPADLGPVDKPAWLWDNKALTFEPHLLAV